jgi:acetoin utilization deacetylase AcuC-like enzyme
MVLYSIVYIVCNDSIVYLCIAIPLPTVSHPPHYYPRHDAGTITYGRQWVEGGEVWENPETKRRFHNLLEASGYIDTLHRIKARYATEAEVLSFHTRSYIDSIKAKSHDRGGDTGESCQFGKGSYEIALLSAGGVLAGVEAIVKGDIQNCYCLVRPPGHHATAALVCSD